MLTTLNSALISAKTAVILAAPDPAPTGGGNAPADGSFLNTEGILTFLLRFVVPILIGIIGIVILTRANRGQVSQVVTSSGIAILGIVFIGGAALLPFIGDDIINLVISAK